MDKFKDKLESLSFPRKRGSVNVKQKVNEDDGSHAGVEIEHWDDRQDAIARPKTIQYQAGLGRKS